MFSTFRYEFLTGLLSLLLIWAALMLLCVTVAQILRRIAPRVSLVTGALAAASFTAGALVSYLT